AAERRAGWPGRARPVGCAGPALGSGSPGSGAHATAWAHPLPRLDVGRRRCLPNAGTVLRTSRLRTCEPGGSVRGGLRPDVDACVDGVAIDLGQLLVGE